MSSMTLRLPNNYVEVERDEMEYIDGGFYISNEGCKSVALACGVNPVGGVLIGLGYSKLTALMAAGLSSALARCGALGGPVGAAIGFGIGALGAINVAGKFASAIVEGKGLNVHPRYTAWGGIPYMVDIDVE